jgi:PAS domain S-box-containing protein/putative nucleotidyltransferase with HDIG domain
MVARVVAMTLGNQLWLVGLAAVAGCAVAGWFSAFRARGRRVRSDSMLARHREMSLDLICTASFDGHFVDVNPAWKKVFGFELEELTSRPFVEFIHPDDLERTLAEVDKQAKTGQLVFNFQNRYRRADGSYRWLEWTSHPDYDAGLMYAVARDITERKQAEEIVAGQRALLEEMVDARTAELEEARWETLRCLALAAEYRDDQTYEHTQRVGRTASLLAEQLGLDPKWCLLIRHAAPLHDVGKVGIPDSILLKPGKLTPEEFEIIRGHAAAGARILSGSKSDLLIFAEEIAASHHEWWDGSGYPYSLAGGAIPLSGRIVAVADVFDALTHQRPYKSAWSVADSVAEIQTLKGRQFDPDVVDAFARLDPYQLAGERPAERDTSRALRAVG